MNTIAAIAVTLKKAAEPAFRSLRRAGAAQCARARRRAAATRGCTLVTGGTDNHMLVLDTVASAGIDGRTAERRLDAVAITTNKQIIPDDPQAAAARRAASASAPPRRRRAACARREMRQLGEWIADTLRDGADAAAGSRAGGARSRHCASGFRSRASVQRIERIEGNNG